MPLDSSQIVFNFDNTVKSANTAMNIRNGDYRLKAIPAQTSRTPIERATGNIAAILKLFEIEQAKRSATPQEQDILAQYVGWGGLPAAFLKGQNGKWGQIVSDLQNLLSEKEYNQARQSTLDAFYTPRDVINAIYRAAQHFGFKGGRILEPSCGIGHFIGAMPPALLQNSHISAVEIDQVSGRIAKLLYPSQDIRVSGLQDCNFINDSFDLVVGNVPFGNFKIHDNALSGYLIHDYFMLKSLALVRPGGIIALITSTGTLDKASEEIRIKLDEKADLLGAIRLPNGTFKGEAGTDANADIIFLRKRMMGADKEVLDWISSLPVEINNKTSKQDMNSYFINNPGMVLGDLEEVSSRHGDVLNVKGTGNLVNDLNKAVRALPAKVMGKSSNLHKVKASAARPLSFEDIPSGLEAGAYFEKSGVIYKNYGSSAAVCTANKTDLERIASYIKIREATKSILDIQLTNGNDCMLQAAMVVLEQAYQKFIDQFGPINLTNLSHTITGSMQRRTPNLKAFRDDPDVYLVASIEDVSEADDGTFTYSRGPIFKKRVIRMRNNITSVDTALDAMIVSLDQKGYLDMSFMSNLYNKPDAEIITELGERIYQNPVSLEWETAESYLSGNVREKYQEAEESKQDDTRFGRNVSALAGVLPEDLMAEDILVSFGAPWVPVDVIRDFLAELLDHTSDHITVRYEAFNAKWSVTCSRFPSVKARQDFGTNEMNAFELAEKALNFKTPRITKNVYGPNGYEQVVNEEATFAATSKMREIERAFTGTESELGWIWKDRQRCDRLCRLYNDRFNAIVARQYDGSHLTFPGLAAVINDARGNPVPFELRKHQKNAAWRIIAGNNTLLAHCVGAGKTFTMIAAGQEMSRIGSINMPCFVVPNHMLDQFSREYNQAYPGARLLVADKENFCKEKRQMFLARVATGHHDAVIITHRAFGQISMSKQYREEFLRSQLNMLERLIENSDSRNPSIKDMERAKRNLEAKIQELMNAGMKDNGLTFEQLGIDYLFIDEAHLFKNLAFVSKMDRVKGLGQADSQRAMDLLMKLSYLNGKNPRKCATFATATPVSNTVAEMFTMQRYLQNHALEELGIEHFDAWAKSFGEVIEDVELAPSGKGFRVVRKFAKFRNVPELINIFSEVADYQTREMLKLPAPKIAGGGAQVIAAKSSQWQQGFIEELAKRAANLSGKPQIGGDNMLRICSEGRKAALDPRLLDPSLPDNANSKVNLLVDQVFDIWKNAKTHDRAQLIFCDLGTPKKNGAFSVYDDISEKLQAMGIPASEIAFAQSAKSDLDKKRLHAGVRQGKIRVLFGSTETLGIGTNVQRLLCAIHHLDAPWRPADVEQRDGRGVRQGNLNNEIALYRYVTERTFDAYSWQALETKAKFIGQLLSGGAGRRHCDDIDTPLPEAAAIKAMATGDQRIIEAVMLEKELTELTHVRNAFMGQRRRATIRASQIPHEIAQRKTDITKLEKDLKRRVRAPLVLNGHKLTSSKPAAQAIVTTIKSALGVVPVQDRGVHRFELKGSSFCGFDLALSIARVNIRSKEGVHVLFRMKGEGVYVSEATTSYNGLNINVGEKIINGLVNAINRMDNSIGYGERAIQQLENELQEAQRAQGLVWTKEGEYQEKMTKYDDLMAELEESGKEDQKEAA